MRRAHFFKLLMFTLLLLVPAHTQATDNDKLTEAHADIGLDLSLSGNVEVAITHLRWVKEHGNQGFVEYPLALSELERIEKVP